jgi:catechol 2,3-dioxygenase-like lactoylglutathione lyase family enzyme
MGITAAVPVLRVSDVEKSIRWYVGTIGFLANPFPDKPPYDFAILYAGEVELMLQCGDSIADLPPKPYRWHVYVKVKGVDMKEVYAKLEAAGRTHRRLERTFYGMAEFEVVDPDGYVICIAQELGPDEGLDLPAPEF